jgi:predicted nuclease of predicted toxin-antitoxin system
MLRFLTDENFDHNIVRGVFARDPSIDLVTVQDEGLLRTLDTKILEWAAEEERILVKHDVATVPKHAFERVAASQAMPGVLVVLRLTPLGTAIEEFLTVAGAGLEEDFIDQVQYIPMRA